MTTSPKAEAEWWRKNFPTVKARVAADEATDALPLDAPMSKYIDTWIAAYLKAGGIRPPAQGNKPHMRA